VKRPLLWWTGIALLALAWGGPLPERAAFSFTAHMTLHMTVVAVAAPLIALGLAGGPYDPVRRWPALFNPIAASIAELGIVWAWHTPLLHRAARGDAAAFAAEQASFLIAGLWLWIGACGGDRSSGLRAWMGMAALLFTSIHMTLLGAIFALAPGSVYAHHPPAAAASDQHLGGSLMLLIGGASYLAGGLGLALRGLRLPPALERGTP
jgi:putative membrane protein